MELNNLSKTTKNDQKTFEVGKTRTGSKVHIIDPLHGVLYCTSLRETEHWQQQALLIREGIVESDCPYPQLVSVERKTVKEIQELRNTKQLCGTCSSWWFNQNIELFK